MTTSFYRILLLLAALAITACETSSPRLPEAWQKPENSPSVLVETYKMAVGDQVSINVWKNQELSVSEPIRPDGRISLPLVGDVMAAGRTPEELSQIIEQKLSVYIKAPNVTVILTALRGHEFLSRIRVTGSVARSMSINYHQGMTVLDAVLEAGSIDLYADANRTKVHRRVNKGSSTFDIKLEDILEDGDMTTNILLLPGDIITVPESRF
jgi:polysaccharide export outer membrane protein